MLSDLYNMSLFDYLMQYHTLTACFIFLGTTHKFKTLNKNKHLLHNSFRQKKVGYFRNLPLSSLSIDYQICVTLWCLTYNVFAILAISSSDSLLVSMPKACKLTITALTFLIFFWLVARLRGALGL